MAKLSYFLFHLFSLFLSLCVAAEDLGPVTCGSTIKLSHLDTKKNLHSHAIAWGSGSGQQSVTATGSQNDAQSLWVVKESHGSKICEIGLPVKCNDVIRLEHSATGKNLHSHLFKAGISPNQEVSGFGDHGTGDTGDNWRVVCDSGKYWVRNQPITLMHADTQKYLYTSEQVTFTNQNCGMQCPIMGQSEVSTIARRDSKTKWQSSQGVYFPVDVEKLHKEL